MSSGAGGLHLTCDNYGTHKHPAVKTVAGRASASPVPLHSHRRLVARPGRVLVRVGHRASHPPQQLGERPAFPLDQVRPHASDECCIYLRLDTISANAQRETSLGADIQKHPPCTAATDDIERGIDFIERELVRDETIERQPAGIVESNNARDVNMRCCVAAM